MRYGLVYILSLFFYAFTYSQVEETHTPIDFSHVVDTTTFHDTVDELRKTIRQKKAVVTIADVENLIQIGHQLDYPLGLGKANAIKGRLYREKLAYALSIKHYKKAISYFEKIDFQKGIAIINNELYITEKHSGNLEKSTYYLLEAKNYFEKRGDSVPLIALNNNLGRLKMQLKDYEFSEQAFNTSIALIKKTGKYRDALGTIMNNLAQVYIEHKKYDEAIETAREAIEINKEDSLSGISGYSYSTLGNAYYAKEEYKKAQKFYDSSLYFYDKGGDVSNVLDAKQSIALSALMQGNLKTAEKLLIETREAYKKTDAKSKLLENYRFTSQLYSAKEEHKEALTWQYKSQQLSDQITLDLSTKKIEKQEELYKRELEQLRTIDQQQLTQRRNKTKLLRYRVFTFAISAILLLSLLFVLWIIKTRKERKRLIHKLNASNEVKNKLFSIISHDLKNEIHGLESSLSLMNDNVITSEEFSEIVPVLANRTNQTSILLHNLLNWSKSQLRELSAKPDLFDMKDLISDKVSFFRPKAREKNIELINTLDVTIVYADKDMISIVAQNLIANAVKFCKAGDAISIIATEKDHHFEIGFADTGVGIAPDNLSKLFAEETFTTRGTQNESGTGLGLRICKELIELNHGNIKVESTLGEGTTFSIALPKSAS